MSDLKEVEKELGFSLTSMVQTLSKKQINSLTAKIAQYGNLLPVLEKSENNELSKKGIEKLKTLLSDIRKQLELTEKQTEIQLNLMSLSESIEIKEGELNLIIKEIKK